MIEVGFALFLSQRLGQFILFHMDGKDIVEQRDGVPPDFIEGLANALDEEDGGDFLNFKAFIDGSESQNVSDDGPPRVVGRILLNNVSRTVAYFDIECSCYLHDVLNENGFAHSLMSFQEHGAFCLTEMIVDTLKMLVDLYFYRLLTEYLRVFNRSL